MSDTVVLLPTAIMFQVSQPNNSNDC